MQFRSIDTKHMTEPWLDQALMESAYKCDKQVASSNIKIVINFANDFLKASAKN